MTRGGVDVIVTEIKTYNKYNVFGSSPPSHPPHPSGKLSSTELVPGAKKVGDCSVAVESPLDSKEIKPVNLKGSQP